MIFKFGPSGTLLNPVFGGRLNFALGGIQIDNEGTLFIYDYSNNTIRRIFNNGTLDPKPVFAGLYKGFELAIDTTGTLFVVNDTTVLRVNSATGAFSTFATGVWASQDLIVDCVGNIYVSNAAFNSVQKISPRGVVSLRYGVGSFPTGLALDSSGNLYILTYNSGTIYKVIPPAG